MQLRCFRAGSQVNGNEKMTVLSFIIFSFEYNLQIAEISITLITILFMITFMMDSCQKFNANCSMNINSIISLESLFHYILLL